MDAENHQTESCASSTKHRVCEQFPSRDIETTRSKSALKETVVRMDPRFTAGKTGNCTFSTFIAPANSNTQNVPHSTPAKISDGTNCVPARISDGTNDAGITNTDTANEIHINKKTTEHEHSQNQNYLRYASLHKGKVTADNTCFPISGPDKTVGTGHHEMSSVDGAEGGDTSNNNIVFKIDRCSTEKEADDTRARRRKMCYTILVGIVVVASAAGVAVAVVVADDGSSGNSGRQAAISGAESTRPSNTTDIKIETPTSNLATLSTKSIFSPTSPSIEDTSTPDQQTECFKCTANSFCIWNYQRCDGIFDCNNFSDEIGCPFEIGWRFCENGVRINIRFWCDGLDDCGDNSDEINCVCESQQEFACSEGGGRCIPSTWVCDGHVDCDSGRDETNCSNCLNDQFVCNDYSCISSSLRCDGKVDCGKHGGDEDNCLSQGTSGDLLVVSERETLLNVCTDGWSDHFATMACTSMNLGLSDSWSASNLSEERPIIFLVSTFDPSLPLLAMLESSTSTACRSGRVVNLSCQQPGLPACGHRKLDDLLVPLVAGGTITPAGKWPWVTSLSHLGKHICGGVILNNMWILTAAHCVTQPFGTVVTSQPASEFTVTAGTNNISPSSSSLTRQTSLISKIFLHPNVSINEFQAYQWDLALLKLSSDLNNNNNDSGGAGTKEMRGLLYSKFIQPICLPDAAEEFTPLSRCYIAGWGKLNFRQEIRIFQLREARLTVWTEDLCSAETVFSEGQGDRNMTLCAGGFSSSQHRAACEGDSGGPLMCEDKVSGHYVLAGIISRGSQRCGVNTSSPTRFVKVSAAAQWINDVMKKNR